MRYILGFIIGISLLSTISVIKYNGMLLGHRNVLQDILKHPISYLQDILEEFKNRISL